MGPALNRWVARLSDFQKRRGAGQVARPWFALEELALGVDRLAVEGLDSRATADCLVKLERAALYYEQRDFADALNIARTCTPTISLFGPAAELFTCNRELLIGDVFLVRDADAAAAAPHFQAAIDASGPATVFIAGNAAINLGICQSLQNKPEEAIHSYKLAREKYEQAGRRDKVAVALHSIGNAYRTLGRIDEGIRELHEAIKIYSEQRDQFAIWSTADDLSRAYLVLADTRPNNRENWLRLASDVSNIASAAGSEVWKVLREEPGRLADLSDQMANHTVTRCEIAELTDDPMDCLGTLALMKGRIRLSRSPIPKTFLDAQTKELRAAVELGAPWANFQIVANALESLRNGKTVAVVDQFALRGNELIIGYAILSSDEKRVGGFHSGLPEVSSYDPSLDLRGRGRGGQLHSECQQLIDAIFSHNARCAMVIPDDVALADQSTRRQLVAWADELQPALERLGDVFFPAEILKEFRAQSVDHVILCIDPLFTRMPYTALNGAHGPIVDEPWSLSLVTASTELIRILDRYSSHERMASRLHWFAPDDDVNKRRGGNKELQALRTLADLDVRLSAAASLGGILSALSNGVWCHFRGHGRWTGSVATSGPVLAQNDVLSSDHYNQIAASSSFLFSAACQTGFGEAVGAEVMGSLVDYDRAGLMGAVLTNWPIHGDAATVFTIKFYERLKQSDDAAEALKHAARETRAILPHPYLWAPFALFGGWSVGSMISWK